MKFVIVNISFINNAIFGCPRIAMTGAVISMTHLCMKFYTPNDIEVVRAN